KSNALRCRVNPSPRVNIRYNTGCPGHSGHAWYNHHFHLRLRRFNLRADDGRCDECGRVHLSEYWRARLRRPQQPLPEAERQVKEIEKLYGARQSQILTGASASRFKAESAGYRVIHLASHAVLDSVNPMYSYALLARSTDDAGTLEARDLMQLNLRADLLLLSGCETARGRGLSGEGISGMLWAAYLARTILGQIGIPGRDRNESTRLNGPRPSG
ncbi:MAG: CHAT domain-containing protein, partial [Candidatus Sulfopaludibacter sp.]|nr:CHAT domain-containing protein [Candidatus Sulfopaludibacter sp.]